ncbi:hypothetical protein U1Q18_010111, partial [Sarracenia purpurea var. burkii]
GGQGGGGVAMVNVKVLPYRLGQCIEALDGKVDSQMEAEPLDDVAQVGAALELYSSVLPVEK